MKQPKEPSVYSSDQLRDIFDLLFVNSIFHCDGKLSEQECTWKDSETAWEDSRDLSRHYRKVWVVFWHRNPFNFFCQVSFYQLRMFLALTVMDLILFGIFPENTYLYYIHKHISCMWVWGATTVPPNTTLWIHLYLLSECHFLICFVCIFYLKLGLTIGSHSKTLFLSY